MIYSRLTAKFKKKEVFSIKGMAFFAFLSVTLFLMVYTRSLYMQQGWIQQEALRETVVANVTSTSFDVVWMDNSTENERWVEWGDKVNVYPNRLTPQKRGEIYIVTFTNLTPEKEYFFRIRAGVYTLIRGKETYFKVKTPKKSVERPVSPAYGKVITAAGKPLSGSVLFYEIENRFPLMTIIKPSGEWLVALTGVVSKKTNEASAVRDEEQVQLRIMGQDGVLARGRVTHTRPVVPMLQSSLFTRLDGENTTAMGVLGESTVRSDTPITRPQIIYPKERGLVPGNTPLIRGVGIPGKEVSVLIKGPKLQYAYRAEISEKGDWIVQYPLALEVGTYTITATTVDASNFPLSLNRTFTIIKSGEQVLGDATGSPTLAPTTTQPSPTLIALQPSPTGAPTPTISRSISPSPILPTYAMPTLIPTAQSAVLPTAIPNLGGGANMFGIAAVFLILVGGIFVLAF